MRTTESVVVPAAAAAVYPFVSDLAAYPQWLPLVHDASPSPVVTGSNPAWDVEIRARVGPFARSKRLRMERIEASDGRLAVFERAEIDGREHARWALRVELDDIIGASTAVHGAPSTVVTMHLAYDGGLWTGGVLEAVLDDQVRRGRVGLAALVSGDATP